MDGDTSDLNIQACLFFDYF